MPARFSDRTRFEGALDGGGFVFAGRRHVHRLLAFKSRLHGVVISGFRSVGFARLFFHSENWSLRRPQTSACKGSKNDTCKCPCSESTAGRKVQPAFGVKQIFQPIA